MTDHDDLRAADALWALRMPSVWESPDARSVPALLAAIGQTLATLAERPAPTPLSDEAAMRIDPEPPSGGERIYANRTQVHNAERSIWDCECGHDVSGQHNGLGCYARVSYEPLVKCDCKRTDDEAEITVERNVAARVAEARADERERIAEAVEDYAAVVRRLANDNRLLHDTGDYLTAAAILARYDVRRKP